MKTSFYFVLWILIYPFLGLFNNSFIDNNSFIVALVIVWGLSWVLNRMMPNTLTYERAMGIAPILEDVYTCNVESFRKRLVRDTNIDTVAAIYFTVTTVAIALAIFNAGVNDWIALIIFGLFTFGAISRSISFIRAKATLKSNPTPEQCMEIAEETYKLDYATYYEQHRGVSYADMLPSRPKNFNAFQIFSIVTASVASLLGIIYIVLAVLIIFGSSSLAAGAFAGMYFLYGSLATYFGIKDIVSTSQAMRSKK